jgi:beta-lactamase regulating signal transducer with metallopeptidase domain
MTCLNAVMTATPMTSSLLNSISPSAMRALGWALVHFLWQGTALAAIAAAAMSLSRRSATRYAIGVATLILMLAAPLVTFLSYSGRLSPGRFDSRAFDSNRYSGAADTVKSLPLVAATWPAAKAGAAASGSISRSAPDAFAWLVAAWLLGVTVFSLRSAGGFVLLERKRRMQAVAVSDRVLEICVMLQRRLGLNRAIAYCECKWLQAPAVIGWFRPIVFLPVTALSGLSDEQLQSVIAHELAHIYRFDAFVNVFQVFVETVLFYHPAIWWLNQRIRTEREHCCDDIAVALCGNAVEYARALTLMEEWRSAPVLAMAANRGPLTERVFRVLGRKTLGAGLRGAGLTGSVVCFIAAIVAGNALVGMAHPRLAQAGIRAQIAIRAVAVASQQGAHAASSASGSAKPSAGQSSSPSSSASSSVSASSSSSSPSQSQSPGGDQTSSGSYIDRMKAAGLTDLSLDTLIALKTQDVTPEFVRSMQEQGLHPDVDSLIALRVQGVTPEYIKELSAAGLKPDLNEIIALKVQDADAGYYRALVAAGIQPNVDTLIALKVQGVTPEYVGELRSAGLAVTADKVIALKVQDVSPEYLKSMHELGIDVKTDQAIGLRVQDVTPEFVRAMQALGLKPSTEELIAMRVQDVTPEFVRDIRALGLSPSIDQLIALRVQDVTPEYIQGMQKAGFKVGINDIISAKVQDVTPEFAAEAVKHGFKDLTLQKLIQLRELGILDPKADL